MFQVSPKIECWKTDFHWNWRPSPTQVGRNAELLANHHLPTSLYQTAFDSGHLTLAHSINIYDLSSQDVSHVSAPQGGMQVLVQDIFTSYGLEARLQKEEWIGDHCSNGSRYRTQQHGRKPLAGGMPTWRRGQFFSLRPSPYSPQSHVKWHVPGIATTKQLSALFHAKELLQGSIGAKSAADIAELQQIGRKQTALQTPEPFLSKYAQQSLGDASPGRFPWNLDLKNNLTVYGLIYGGHLKFRSLKCPFEWWSAWLTMIHYDVQHKCRYFTLNTQSLGPLVPWALERPLPSIPDLCRLRQRLSTHLAVAAEFSPHPPGSSRWSRHRQRLQPAEIPTPGSEPWHRQKFRSSNCWIWLDLFFWVFWRLLIFLCRCCDFAMRSVGWFAGTLLQKGNGESDRILNSDQFLWF